MELVMLKPNETTTDDVREIVETLQNYINEHPESEVAKYLQDIDERGLALTRALSLAPTNQETASILAKHSYEGAMAMLKSYIWVKFEIEAAKYDVDTKTPGAYLEFMKEQSNG